ncbi:unnamed protein product [Paramecium pentaurelia]|uniref:Uncharacterized protein n=1 Tax=Paramecium pentaurelia TaxID=43138 RepID=A0A8S1TQR5_9CILI|nr:unnamed protein product [Paramecium pentaurelia]
MKSSLIACLLLSVLSVEITLNNAITTQALEKLKESSWASFIVEFAEVELSTGGALSELIETINQLIEQLQEELQDIHNKYSRRTDEHNRDVTRLEQEIQDAAKDIFTGQDFIDNVLIPQKERFQQSLVQLKINIEENRRVLDGEIVNRKRQHEQFLSNIAELNEAIGAVDESLGLLSQISNPSLIQFKRVQTNLGRIQTSFQNRSSFAPIIKALLELATEQNFTDQGSVQQLVKIFNELRVQFVDSLNQETADESQAETKYTERVAQLEKEFAEFQRSVLIKNSELAANEQKLGETIVYVGQRKDDKETLEAQLQAENDNYAAETDLYTRTVTEYNKEIDISKQAYGLLTQPSFESYVRSTVGI